MDEYVNEMFRSDIGKFHTNFADYLVSKRLDKWDVKNCTFFRDNGKQKMWAWCLFERNG